MLDDRVRTREHQAGVTVVESDQVGRLPARSADFDDLARPFRLAHGVAIHVKPIPDGCLHEPTSSPAFARDPVHPKDTLTVCRITMASIYLDADRGYRLWESTAR
jgi:hypothetical protein